MQKLKATVVHKMIQQQLTSAEVSFILYLSHYQDDTGRVVGVYYKEISNKLNLSYQGFYDVLHGLENKGIIKAEKNFNTDWDIVIVGNDCSECQESYISTGHKIFHEQSFLDMKANEKLLAMLLIQYAGANSKAIKKEHSGKYCIGVSKFYEKYTDLFSISKRVIQRYLHTLKQFFTIGIKDKKYFITPLVQIFKKEYDTTDAAYFTDHIRGVACRRNKVDCSVSPQADVKDTFDLIGQYHKQLKGKVADLFLNALQSSISIANKNVKEKNKWKRVLKPKFIHKLMRNELEEISIYGTM